MVDNLELLLEVVSDLTGSPPSKLKDSPGVLRQTAVAEALRIAAFQVPVDEAGWRVGHVQSMRSWVIRKLRGLGLWVDSSLEDTVIAVLSEGPGPNLEFLGDLVSLRSGYYAPAPSRAVPISPGSFLLVSGVPSREILGMGLSIRFHGPCRWIVESSEDVLRGLGIHIQTRQSYLGEFWTTEPPDAFLTSLLRLLPQGTWDMEVGSAGYLGHRPDSFDFESEWGTLGVRVNLDYGALGIWKSPREFGGSDYFLRITSKTGNQVRKIPRRLVKRTLLAFEAVLGRRRQVQVNHHDSGLVIGLDFRPPESMLRWIHALGGVWRGSKGNRIFWNLESSTWSEVVEMVQAFWLESPERGG